MELKDQVVSLELAQKLKELGVKQESLFYWLEHYVGPASRAGNTPMPPKPKVIDAKNAHKILSYNKFTYAAFTVAELGEMLPGHVVAMDGSW
jgi:hypothetical protein